MDLPLVVWRHVVQFLSDAELKRLYPVNRALYCIAMGLRYHEVSIGNTPVLNLSVCEHVQSLRIKPNPLIFLVPYAPPTGGKARKSITIPTRIIHRINTYLPWHRHTSELEYTSWMQHDMTQRLHRFISLLPHLTKLTIEWDAKGMGRNSFLPATSLLATGWTTFGARLRHLTLAVPIELWPKVLAPSLHLDVLESLTLRAEKFAFNTDDTAIIRAVLLPFIRNHSSTLTALTFSSFQNLDLTSLYHGVGHLPRLNRIEIEQPYQPVSNTHSDGLYQFLKEHLYQLNHFHWSFFHDHPTWASQPAGRVWYAQLPYTLTPPKLRTLKLGLFGLPQFTYAHRMFSYAGRHTLTLTSLSLNGWIFDAALLETLLRAIASPILQDLELSLRVLTSSIFSALSEKLPHLALLKLRYAEVGRHQVNWGSRVLPNKQHFPTDVHEEMTSELQYFGQDMEVANLADWPLQVVHLEKLGWYIWQFQPVDRVASYVLKGLPRVVFLNGRYREEFFTTMP